jgi:NAD(P)-dependent dehydrogenase (short-subunit alcohol dehydrogenase family)
MGLLEGHRAVVTGGASGIGRATCRRFTEEGARVAVLDIDGDGAQKVADELGGFAAVCDVADPDDLRRAVDEAAAELGGLSVIFNNAGIGSMSPLHGWSPEEWNRLIAVNLTGVYAGFRAAIPHLLANGGGCVVSTASISGVRPAAGEAPYSAAKAGVAALTASAALEYAPNIRVNAVSPGLIQTALTEPLLQIVPGATERYERTTPLHRLGEPEDIADVVVFLCSDLARFITGQNLVVDGGMTLHGSGIDGIFDQIFGGAPPS